MDGTFLADPVCYAVPSQILSSLNGIGDGILRNGILIRQHFLSGVFDMFVIALFSTRNFQ